MWLAQGQIWPVLAIIPSVLIEMLRDEDSEKLYRVMQAMLKMNKIDIATLKHAYDVG